MSNHLLPIHKRGVLIAAALCAALALSACGDAGDRPSSQPQPPAGATPPAPTPPVAQNDSFFAYVAGIVANLFDNTEPVAIDAVTETRPEDTEPQPVT